MKVLFSFDTDRLRLKYHYYKNDFRRLLILLTKVGTKFLCLDKYSPNFWAGPQVYGDNPIKYCLSKSTNEVS